MKWIAIIFCHIVFLQMAPAQENEESEDLRAREDYRFMMRADENGRIPLNALLKAKKELDAKGQLRRGNPASTADAGIQGWEWIGPGNVGGRIRAIIINPVVPNVMYVGGVSGGVWRTDNAGDSWYPLADFMANLGVTSLVMDPANPLVIYAGTGETGFGASASSGPPGAGIFKSTDAGLTWTQLPSTVNNNFTGVTRLSHHPTAANTLLAATNTGIWLTTNGGTTWNSLLAVSATQVKYHPSNPNRILCGTTSNFYLSTDGGNSWQQQTTGEVNKLPASPGRCEGDFALSDNTVYVNVQNNENKLGEVWRSADDATWTLRTTGTYFGSGDAGWYDNAIWVDPSNSARIVLSGRNLQRSTDGGTTLNKIGGDTSGAIIGSVHPDIHAIIPHPQYNGTTNKTVFIGCDGGIYRTTDITTASLSSGWEYLNHNLGITQFYGGSAAPDGSVIAGGAQDNNRLHYTPALGSESWFEGKNGGGDGTIAAVDFTNPDRIYMATTSLSIARSDDGGHTYTPKVNGISDAGLWVAPLVMDPNNAATLFAGGKKIWKTTDNAENWSVTPSTAFFNSSCTAIDIAKGNSNLIWAGYNKGQLTRSTDGGASWTDFVGGGRPNTAVTDIAISPFNSSEVIVTQGGYIPDNVWMTTDGGTTWINRTGLPPNNLPSIQVNTVRYHPLNPDWVYVGTDLGVFASEDRGRTWNVAPAYGGNEGPANVEVSELFWQGNDFLVAATFGRGMFRSRPLLPLYVDQANPQVGNGSIANPYSHILDAISAQQDKQALYLKAGNYQVGAYSFTKRGRIVGWNGTAVIK